MGFEKMGATGESLRLKNNEWFIARSANGRKDIRIFKVDDEDNIHFHSMPIVNDKLLVDSSVIQALVERIEALENSSGGSDEGSVKMLSLSITQEMLDSKNYALPQIPSGGKIVLLPNIGVPQISGEDFSLTNEIISWDGYDLENILALNDKLIIIYSI
jgi:hypothetical protein